MKPVYSFDIFDTAITRSVANPRAIFSIFQSQIVFLHSELPHELCCNFVFERIAAEKQVRRISQNEDISIDDIYGVIKQKFALTDAIVDSLIDFEIALEKKFIRVIPETAKLIADLRTEGTNVVYISDMYLPQVVIRNILTEADLFIEGDSLYVSGHVGLRKKTGRLFKHVLEAKGVLPSQVIHAGDHRRNDYLMARLNGIKSIYLKRGRLNHYEKLIAGYQQDKPEWLTCQFLAGASRVARLEAYLQNDLHLRTLREIGANVAGPVFLLFVYWLLIEAKKDNVKTLYFLARDGQILMRVAAIVAKQLGFSIEMKYLYVSRQSLLAPSFIDFTAAEIDWILHKDPVLTITLVGKRLSVDFDDFVALIQNAGFPRIKPDADITPELKMQLRKILLNDKDVRLFLDRNFVELRKRVLGYFRQQGLCTQSNWAVVDSGWNGRLQNSIQVILQDAGCLYETRGYYFGLFDQHGLHGLKKGFLFSPMNLAYIKWCRPFTFIFEMMSSAPHGTTLGYEKTDKGECKPVLDSSGNGRMAVEIAALRAGVFDYVNALEYDHLNYNEALFRQKSFGLLKKFYLNPSRLDAEAFGAMTYSNDQTDCSRFELAPVMTLKDCGMFALKMLGQTKYAQTFWLNGSRARSRWYVKPLLWCLEKIHFFLNSVYVKYLFHKVRKSTDSQ